MQPISTYLRCRPQRNIHSGVTIDPKGNRILFDTVLNQTQEYQTNHAGFLFSTILGPSSSQEHVYQTVCDNMIDDVITGRNCSVFAYGQTGSGKTYTMTGSVDSYSTRGLIPRCLENLFQRVELHKDDGFEVSISYIEIYNDDVYDLLCDRGTNEGFRVSRVSPFEDLDGFVRLRGLQKHKVTDISQALGLLFRGDACRVVAETSMNDCSTRSHCIFDIVVTRTENSKLVDIQGTMRLVDLAGSERIGHVDAGDIVFNEGRSINLSLHYLEQVIVALNEKITNQRKHIPYRNSVLTWILKDSLGGNSRSALIATISMEIEHVAESISTCRFATRVSLVQNFPVVNQIVDTKIIIDRLSKENEFLRSQLSNQTGYNSRVILSDEDMSNLRQRVEYFLRRPEPNEFSCGSREEAEASWPIFHQLYNAHRDCVEQKAVEQALHSETSTEKRVSESESLSQRLRILCSKGQSLGLHAGTLRSDILSLKEKLIVPEEGSNEYNSQVQLRLELLKKHDQYSVAIDELKQIKLRIAQIQEQLKV